MSYLSFGISNSGLSRSLRKSVVLSGLLISMLAIPAFADDAADVTKLLRGGQLAEALAKTDASLAQKPRDAQLRFLKGVILTEQGKSADAIAIFTKLTEDFPELPEPYNNLAVLYASSSQYDKARAALDMAIRTNPSYATAYENLGDVHAKLASQAYDKALALDSSNSGAKSKLTLLRSLAGSMASNVNPKTAAAPVAPATKTAAATVSSTVPKAQTPVVVAAVKPEPTKAEVKRDAEEGDVLASVYGWAKAWSAQDMKAYLAHYANDFKTPRGISRSAWVDERRSRINGKERISVKIESAQADVKGNTATVKFRQIYSSDRLKANSRKTLDMVKHDGKWKIKQERTGS